MAEWKEDKPIKSEEKERDIFAWDEANVYLQNNWPVKLKILSLKRRQDFFCLCDLKKDNFIDFKQIDFNISKTLWKIQTVRSPNEQTYFQ